MSRQAPVTEQELFSNSDIHRETGEQRTVTLQIPSELDSIGAQEWNRLVAERQAQPNGILPGDGPFFKVAAQVFSGTVLMRSRLIGLSDRRAYDIYFPPRLRFYIGLCHSLNCTPAIPNRSRQ